MGGYQHLGGGHGGLDDHGPCTLAPIAYVRSPSCLILHIHAIFLTLSASSIDLVVPIIGLGYLKIKMWCYYFLSGYVNELKVEGGELNLRF